MEVTCSRCQSVYDFEDTLVSSKGVVVRCTHCGHLFKIFPPGIESVVAEESGWMLRREDGTVFAIDRFSTLQKWIAQCKVTRRDHLSRTGETWKALGDIVELEPFFGTVERRSGEERSLPTRTDMPALADGPSPDRPGPMAGKGRLEIPAPYTSVVPSPSVAPSIPPEEPPPASSVRISEVPRRTADEAPDRATDIDARADTTPAASRPVRRDVVGPGDAMSAFDYDELPPKRHTTAWVVVIVILVGGLVAGAVFRRQISGLFHRLFGGSEQAPTASERSLEKADRLFASETTDSLRQAEDEYAKILKFNVGDTRAMAGLLEVRTTRAQFVRDEIDIAVLLNLDDRDPSGIERLRASFDAEMTRADELALGLQPSGGNLDGLGVESQRALADVERLRGNREGARALAGRAIAGAPGDPRALYVGAMIALDDALSSTDLVGATPLVEEAFARVLAVDPGKDIVPRARLHLALYLALVGRRDEATAHVRCVVGGGAACPDGRGASHRDHLIASRIEAWLPLIPTAVVGPIAPSLPYGATPPPPVAPVPEPDAGAAGPDAGAAEPDAPEGGAEAGEEAVPEVGAEPEAAAAADAAAGPREAATEMPATVSGLLEEAKNALEYGSTQRAISLLQRASQLEPSNVEVLVNLGYAFMDAGRRPDARRQFERANQVSGGHPDALLGMGDIMLEQGSLDGALDAYRQALSRARTPYQRRIAERKVRDLEERLGRRAEDGEDAGGARAPGFPTPPPPGPPPDLPISDTPAVGSEPPGLPPVTEP